MRPVPQGTRGSFSMVVAPEHLANRFKDASLPPVLSTPVMIMGIRVGLDMVNQVKGLACIIIDDNDKLYASKNIHLQ